MMIEKILELIRQGEGERVEFKSRAARVSESICALANTEGGYILVGVDDDGRIIGTTKADEEKLTGYLQTLAPLPKLKIKKAIVDKKIVLFLEVSKSPTIVSIGNLAYVRAGRSNKPLSIDELVIKATELGKIRFDESPSPAGRNYLKREYLNWYFEKRNEMRNVRKIGTLQQNMARLKIVHGKNKSRLTFGGLLFFSDHACDFLPDAKLRVIELTSESETVNEEEFTGPIWKIADASYRYILSKVKSELRVGVKRMRVLEYPERALREAIVNALVHRNYFIPADVRIFLHPNKIVVRSPGSLPPGVNLEEPEHVPRNPLLCQYMYDVGYIERYGFGITKMRKECERHPLVELKINPAGDKVDVIFARTRHPRLDELDRKIIALVSTAPRRSSEIAREIGISKVATVERLNRLLQWGAIEKHGRGVTTTYSAE